VPHRPSPETAFCITLSGWRSGPGPWDSGHAYMESEGVRVAGRDVDGAGAVRRPDGGGGCDHGCLGSVRGRFARLLGRGDATSPTEVISPKSDRTPGL
jgi:hypothetical protein